ncbi:glucan endo-1,3-beta-D-glucosidase-like [Momordica charantia]|uniref:glucan endo-1,3-beta-D-glucosidase n=1 Tax=Momordica charantia TaxID=3673 RepID=A0A6J1DX18_MOMCH|nr:glucan endo-1,3-beta-D-glucosidase-like [Momordica charantia]
MTIPSSSQSMSIFSFLYLLLSTIYLVDAAGFVGVNYGRLADDLPPPPKVVELLKNQGINKVKIFDTDATVLTALANSGISVIVCLPNQLLFSAAASQSFTDQWVQANITKFYPATKIEAIAAGNEVFVDPTNITNFLVPAMKNLHASLQKYKLSDSIKVSSPIAFSALASSYPTSSGSFKQDLADPVMKPMLEFFRQTQSYLMVNIYPFFAYAANSDKISLNYTLFQDNPGVLDSGNGLKYLSLFEAQVDAVYAAMSALKYDDIKLVITETGWPSKGDSEELGASVGNAASYNGNLVRRVLTGGGTPMKPKDPINAYLFALFNEYQKPGPTSERNYGLFYPNEQMVYDIPLTSDQLKNGPKTSVNGSNDNVPPTSGTPPASGTPPTSGVPPSQGQTWCVANANAGADKLQAGLEYVCGTAGADCGPIQSGATCYNPNTLEAHASYAFNSFYQKNDRAVESCDFNGAASIVDKPPQYGDCEFPTGSDSGTPSIEGQTWCVANANVGADKLQAGLEYACGSAGADCGPIQPGAACYNPNTLEAHASYAFNSFYQKNDRAAGSCDFDGAASVVDQPPQYGDCKFPMESNSGMPPASGTPPTSETPPASGTPSSQSNLWCVAKPNTDEAKLQAGLQYACGEGGADCGPIQPGSTCYNPNTLEAHASYAFNSYFQKKNRVTAACDFGGAAFVSDKVPTYGDCKFPTGQ